MMGVSHLHPDHISDLPALLWGGRMVRQEPLPIIGPSGATLFELLALGKDTAANEEQTPWWRPILLLNATHDRASKP